jgi:hypothetical protein
MGLRAWTPVVPGMQRGTPEWIAAGVVVLPRY